MKTPGKPSIVLMILGLFFSLPSLHAQSNQTLASLSELFAGVKYARIAPSENHMGGYEEGTLSAISLFLRHYQIQVLGTNTRPESLCDVVEVWYSFDDVGPNWRYVLRNIQLSFKSCDQQVWTMPLKKISFSSRANYSRRVWKHLKSNLPVKRLAYNTQYRRELPSLLTNWDELTVRNYLAQTQAESIEGIYEQVESNTVAIQQNQYSCAIIKEKGIYKVIYFSGATYPKDWNSGELKAILQPTATEKFFKMEWYGSDKTLIEGAYLEFEGGALTTHFPSLGQRMVFLKVYPHTAER